MVKGDFEGTEKMLTDAASGSATPNNTSIFDAYISKTTYTPVWRRILPHTPMGESSNNSESVPGMRGGHQMCFDVHARKVYLLGGWNGTKDLADFWCFDVVSEQWTCLSHDTRG